ncbi:MAG: Mov34/MPN/PAD-1 family protein [Sulfolobales archaeon]
MYLSTSGGPSLKWGKAIVSLVALPKHLVNIVCSLAERYGKEVVGFGIGFSEGGRVLVEDIIIGENLSEEVNEFYLDPVAIIEAFKYSELGGYEVVALVHTHRQGTSPSSLDVEGMRLWPIPWIIVDELDCSVKAWILKEKGELEELTVELVPT